MSEPKYAVLIDGSLLEQIRQLTGHGNVVLGERDRTWLDLGKAHCSPPPQGSLRGDRRRLGNVTPP